jgi:hypothetical protein
LTLATHLLKRAQVAEDVAKQLGRILETELPPQDCERIRRKFSNPEQWGEISPQVAETLLKQGLWTEQTYMDYLTDSRQPDLFCASITS